MNERQRSGREGANGVAPGFSRNLGGQPRVPARGMGTGGTGNTGGIGVGLKYVSPEASGGTIKGLLTGGGTLAGGGTKTTKSIQDYSMQLHGNDFADLKYFEPGEHQAQPQAMHLAHSNTFDQGRQTRAPQGCYESHGNLRRDTYSQLSDSLPSQQRSVDRSGSSRMAMISQAVHRYDSAIKQAVHACQRPQGGLDVERRATHKMPSAEDQGSHYAYQISKSQPGRPASILKKKSPSFAGESGSNGWHERERGPQPRFGIRLLPTPMEERPGLDHARVPALNDRSPQRYRHLRARRVSEGSLRSSGEAGDSRLQRLDRGSGLGAELGTTHQRVNTVSDLPFTRTYDGGMAVRHRPRHAGDLRNAPEPSPRQTHQTSHQQLYTLASAGSDLDGRERDQQCRQPWLLAGSKTQECFGRLQHESLVRSMNQQIQRQNERELERIHQDRRQMKDQAPPSTQEEMKEEIRRRELQLQRDKDKLFELEAAAVARGRAQDFRAILRGGSFEKTMSAASQASRSNSRPRKSPMERALQFARPGVQQPTQYDPLDHDLSKYDRGVCPLRYKVQPEDAARPVDPGNELAAQQPELLEIDSRIGNKIRNLSEEHRHAPRASSRQIKMQDKISRLKKEFDVMFSPKNRSSKLEQGRTLQSLSNSCDDLLGVRDSPNDLSNTLMQRPLGEGTAKFTELLAEHAKASTAPMFQSGHESEYLRGNHFTLGEQARHPDPPQQQLCFQHRSKSAHVDRQQSYEDFQSASFRNRITNLASTFLGRRSKSIGQQGHSRAAAEYHGSSARLPFLDASRLKYTRANQELEEVLMDHPIAMLPYAPLPEQERPVTPQLVGGSCHTAEQYVASPTKSTIHQAFSKSPPVLSGPTAYGDGPRVDPNLCAQILQNKERLGRLLRDDSKLGLARRGRLKSASSNQRGGQSPTKMPSFHETTQSQHLDSQRSHNHHGISRAPHTQDKSSQRSKLFTSRLSYSGDHDARFTHRGQNLRASRDPSRRSNKESSRLNCSETYMERLSQSSIVQQTPSPATMWAGSSKLTRGELGTSSQTPIEDSVALDRPRAGGSSQQPLHPLVLHRSEQAPPPVGSALGSQPQHNSSQRHPPNLAIPSVTQTGPTTIASRPALIVKNFVPNSDLMIGEVSTITARRGEGLEYEKDTDGAYREPEPVAEAAAAKKTTPEYNQMKSEMLTLKEEVLSLQAKLLAKEKARRQKTELSLTQATRDGREADKMFDMPSFMRDKMNESIEAIKAKYHDKYKQRYEKKLNEERKRNQETIDNLKVELQNIQLKYGKRVAKMESEIKTATASQLKDLDQRYKEREHKMKSKYEKRLHEMKGKMQELEKENKDCLRDAQIEREVKLRVDEAVHQKDSLLKLANQRIRLLENLIQLGPGEGCNPSTARPRRSPPGHTNASAHPETTSAESAALAQSAVAQGAGAAAGQLCNRPVLADASQLRGLKQEPPLSSTASQRQQKQSRSSGSLHRHQRSKSMTFQGGRKASNAQALLPNETLKSLEKAMHIVDLSLSPKSTSNHQKVLHQFMQQLQKQGAKVTSQVKAKVGPGSFGHNINIKGVQPATKHKKQAATCHNITRGESIHNVYGAHMHPGQQFASHFLHLQKQPTSSKSSNMPMSGSRVHKASDQKLGRENMNLTLLEATKQKSDCSMTKTQSQASMKKLKTRQALRQITGGVPYDQSKSLQKNLAVMKDAAMKEPLVLSVFESAGKHSDDTDGFEEKENYGGNSTTRSRR